MASPEQNILWKPPDRSNNGSNKCWVNAPLYAILSNNEIREQVNNIVDPTEDQLSALSVALKLPTMENLKVALADIDNLTDKDVPDIEQDRPICVGLANAENNTLLNRLHITIFLLVVRNALMSVEGYNDVLPNKINTTLNGVTLKSIAGVDTQESPLLRLLYGPAIKQFIDPDVPWTDVLYRTFALLILRREVTDKGNVVDRIQKVILGAGSEDASRTIGFIEDVFDRYLNINNVKWTQYPSIVPNDVPTLNNDFDQTNLISIVSATKCTDTANPDSEHFKSYVKMGESWFEVDALHNNVDSGDGIGNFKSTPIGWTDIVNQYNCVNDRNKNRVMYTILYEPEARIAGETEAAREAAAAAAAAAEQERLATASASTEEQKPSPFFQTIIEQLPENSTSQPNKGYINLLNIAFTRYNQNERPADGKLMLKNFKPTTDKKGKQVNYSPITDEDKFKQFDTDINALYRAATAGNSEIGNRSGGGKKTRKARLPPQKKPVTSNRTRSRNRDGKKRIR
jgi:hypothetical protein